MLFFYNVFIGLFFWIVYVGRVRFYIVVGIRLVFSSMFGILLFNKYLNI